MVLNLRHEIAMLSLDNAFDDDELDAFIAMLVVFLSLSWHSSVEPKLDGLAVSLLYENGVLVQADSW